MVAVIILTFTIAVFMNVVSNNYFYGKYARNEITANYLLQEVVDYIKNDRDTSIVLTQFTTDSWINFLDKYYECSGDDGCTIDAYSGGKTICNGECISLYYHSTPNPNFYNYDPSGVATSFVRKIHFEQNADNLDQLDVTVTVDWKNGNLNKSKELKTSIMKW